MTKLKLPKTTFLTKVLDHPIYSSSLTIDTPLFSFLETALFPKLFFRFKHCRKQHLAIGTLLKITPEKALSLKLDIPLYGSIHFDQKKDPSWEGFDKPFFFIPEFEVIQNKEKTTLFCYSFKEEEKEISLDDFKKKPDPLNPILFLNHTPTLPDWKEALISQINLMKKGPLNKVVLSRKTEFSLKNPPSFTSILKKLLKVPNSHTFGFILSNSHGFFGASPETLFTRENTLLKTEAVAATRKRGEDDTEDTSIENEMKNSPKDKLEFSLVKDSIEKTLLSFGKNVAISPLSVYKNPYIQHLHSTFSTNTHADSYSIIEKLHPTPAIGGYPKDKALLAISSIEPFSRRLYAAILGLKEKNREQYLVAIRSFIISNNKLTLFSGAGIVKDSDPEKEWEELNLKMETILQSGGFTRANTE